MAEKIKSNVEVHGVAWAAAWAARKGIKHQHGAQGTVREVLSMDHVEWTRQLNRRFDAAMVGNGGPRTYDVMWCEGLHMLYCMGGEL